MACLLLQQAQQLRARFGHTLDALLMLGPDLPTDLFQQLAPLRLPHDPNHAPDADPGGDRAGGLPQRHRRLGRPAEATPKDCF